MARQPQDPAPDKAKATDERELVRDLAALLDETNLTEIEIERAGLRVRGGRKITVITAVAAPFQNAPSAAAPQAAPIRTL